MIASRVVEVEGIGRKASRMIPHGVVVVLRKCGRRNRFRWQLHEHSDSSVQSCVLVLNQTETSYQRRR